MQKYHSPFRYIHTQANLKLGGSNFLGPPQNSVPKTLLIVDGLMHSATLRTYHYGCMVAFEHTWAFKSV